VPPSSAPDVSRATTGAVVPWAAGVILRIAAWIVSGNLDEKDAETVVHANARSGAQGSFGGPTYRVSPKSDRTPVHLLAGLGAAVWPSGSSPGRERPLSRKGPGRPGTPRLVASRCLLPHLAEAIIRRDSRQRAPGRGAPGFRVRDAPAVTD
jgi:hypothetical protein